MRFEIFPPMYHVLLFLGMTEQPSLKSLNAKVAWKRVTFAAIPLFSPHFFGGERRVKIYKARRQSQRKRGRGSQREGKDRANLIGVIVVVITTTSVSRKEGLII